MTKPRFQRDLHRDAVMTDAAMRDNRLNTDTMYQVVAGMNFGLSPDDVLVHYPKWAAKWPREYREKVAAELERMDAAKTQ